MTKTKRDANQISKYEHDEASNAKRVKITDTEFNMELNHADGDSVTAHPAKLSISVEGVGIADSGNIIVPPMDCSSLRKLRAVIDGTGDIEIEVSMSDTHNHWVTLGGAGEHEICARRFRVKSVDAQGDVHLAGRS